MTIATRISGAVLLGLILARNRWAIFMALGVSHLLLAATFIVAWGGEAQEPIAMLLGLVSIGLVLSATHGSYSAELRSGRVVLWLQKPVSPMGHFLTRWCAATTVSLLMVLALTLLTALLLRFLLPAAEGDFLRAAPLLLLIGLILSSLVFGVSGWGAHPDSLVAVLLFFLSLPLAIVAQRTGEGVMLIRVFLVPWDELVRLGEFLSGTTGPENAPSDATAVAITACLWILVGLLGIHARSRSPSSGGTAS